MDDVAEREVNELVDGLCRIVVHRDPSAAVHLEATAALTERLARELEDELGIRMFAARDAWLLDATTEIAAATGG